MTPAPRLSWGSDELDDAITRIAEALRDADHVLVAAHQRPDGDAIGCTLAATHALRHAGLRATACNQDGVPANLRFLPGADEIVTAPPEDVDCILALDCAQAHRLGATLEPLAAVLPVYCLDHHRVFDPDFAAILALDADAAACAELVYRLVAQLGIPLTLDIAQPLFAALHTDTGSFRYASTRAGTMELGRILLGPGFDVWEVCSQLYESHPLERLRLLPRVLDTLTMSRCGRFASLTVSHAIHVQTHHDESVLGGVINFARGIRGVEVATLLTEVGPDQWRVSFRSRGTVDVSVIAAKLGGGGHRNAAACDVSGKAKEILSDLESAFVASVESAT